MSKTVTGIILAAGSGSRMKLGITKQKIIFGEETVLRRSARIFNECPDIDSIVIVARADEIGFATEQTRDLSKVRAIVAGGASRAESAKCGFVAAGDTGYVAIHDAARCFVTAEMISKVIADAKKYGAATASSVVTDTVKSVDGMGRVTATVDRNTLRSIQTPQVFISELYGKALTSVSLPNASITDDNSLLERIGVFSYCTDTGKNNIKITTKEDLILANACLNGEYAG